jgi:hypothetical protein
LIRPNCLWQGGRRHFAFVLAAKLPERMQKKVLSLLPQAKTAIVA